MPRQITYAELTAHVGVSPDTQAALGRVCAWSAKVDHELSKCIWHLAGLSEAVGAAFTTSHSTVNGRLNIFGTLIPLTVTSDKDREKFLRLEKTMRNAFEERNRCVHDEIYVHNPTEETAGLVKARYKVRPDKTIPAPKDLFGSMSPTSLDALTRKFVRIYGRLQQYLTKSDAWKDDVEFP